MTSTRFCPGRPMSSSTVTQRVAAHIDHCALTIGLTIQKEGVKVSCKAKAALKRARARVASAPEVYAAAASRSAHDRDRFARGDAVDARRVDVDGREVA